MIKSNSSKILRLSYGSLSNFVSVEQMSFKILYKI